MPADLLKELQATFPAGATRGTFNPSHLLDGAYAALTEKLGCGGDWTLKSAQGWSTDGVNISLDGALDAPVLGVNGTSVWIRFVPAGTGYDMLIDISLPASWVFGQTCKLLDTELFAGIPVSDVSGQGSALVIASAATTDPRRQQAGQPAAMAAGLNFFGYLSTAGAGLAQIAWILQAGDVQAIVGPVDYDSGTGAVAMALAVTTATLPPLFGSGGPALSVGLFLHSGLDQIQNLYRSGIRFSAALDFATDADPDQQIILSALFANPSQGLLELSLTGSALAFPTPTTLSTYLGPANGIVQALPPQLSSPDLLRVDGVLFAIGLQSRRIELAMLSVSALAGQTWKIWPGVIEVGDINFRFSILAPLEPESTPSFSFTSRWDLGDVPIVVSALLPGKVLSGALDPTQPLPALKPLVQKIFHSEPGLPDDLVISKLNFAADAGQKVYSIELEIEGEWSITFGDDNEMIFERLSLSAAYDEDGASGEIAGAFSIDEAEFSITLDLSAEQVKFLGTWDSGEGNAINYQDVAIALGLYGLPNLPDAIDLSLQSGEFQLETAGPTIAFDFTTGAGNKAALVAGKAGEAGWGFVFGMVVAPNLSLDLTQIPVAGAMIPAGAEVVSIDELRFVGATTALPPFDPTPEMEAIFGSAISSGLVLSVALSVGTELHETFTVRFGGSDDGTSSDSPPGKTLPFRPTALPVRLADAPASAPPGPQAMWIDVQRSFGPIRFDRIGFAIKPDNSLALLLDAGLSQSGLSIDLTGLEAAMKIGAPFSPSFSLAGLRVAYASPSFEVAGGLKLSPGLVPPVYSGEIVARMGTFGATLLGSYTTVNGSPSLFGYLFIDTPLGGPACFFVTGVAGGFGYNRSLQLPTVDSVATYPLVLGATGGLDEADTLTRLEQLIAPAPNQNWVALGVRFTSFEMVRSFALVTVSFGAVEEIALLGTSTISLPTPAKGETSDPVARAELELLVQIEPSQGYVAASAQLSPNSYVLSKEAQLSGGFAFYTWFAPSPHAGDFVVTLGGYNPYFSVPKHYPTPPRLGLNWQISSDLKMKGELYFALTPSVVMAGGAIECVWESGDLKAWYDARIDFLMRFKPFGYRVDISISVGFELTIDLLFTSTTITMHVGVDLLLYGDPFGGEARIDLSIVSFTISFGAAPPPPPAVDWGGFVQSFLPPVIQGRKLAFAGPMGRVAPAPPPPTPTDSLLVVSAPTGLLATAADSEGNPTWIVDPAALTLVITAQIPSKGLTVTPAVDLPPSFNGAFGVGPMGLAPADFDVELEVEIDRDATLDNDEWTLAPILSSLPSGLWLNAAARMQAGGLVEGVLTGLSLTPSPPAGAETVPIPLSVLLAGDPPICDWAWSATPQPGPNPYDQATAMATLQTALAAPKQSRPAVLAELARQGLPIQTSVNVKDFAAKAPNILGAPPTLSDLGGTPAIPNVEMVTA